ncbi:MAG: hypothetical protein QGI75_04690 [Phycisphaerales bacterium]|jgi:hypothetical protein|nr:hypothetical protein [Phycisphaerales bacterium]MDP6890395.1 hypothetical protein [Phycisphaerales bacterium]
MSIIPAVCVALPLAVALVFVADRLMRSGNHEGLPARLVQVLWIPVLVILPGLGLITGGGHMLSIESLAGISLGPLVGVVAVPLLLLGPSQWSRDQWHADDRLPLAWPAIGVLLMALAVAGRVPEFLTLVAFALGVVLLWMETTPRSHERHGGDGGGWVLLGVVLASALAVVNAVGPGGWLPLVIAFAAAWAIIVRASVRLGRRRTLLAVGWAAMMGPVLGLGVLGQDGLRGTVLNTLKSDVVFVGYRGLGGLAKLLLPGLLLLAICGLIAGWPRWSLTVARWVAALMVAAGTFVVAAVLTRLS